MTIPSNISYTNNRHRLTVRCTCNNYDKISITLKKKQGGYDIEAYLSGPGITVRPPFALTENLTNGFDTRPLATEVDVQWYLRSLVDGGRIPMTKAKSMLHALQDRDLRSIGGSLTESGHVDWVDGGPVITENEDLDPYAP